MAELASFISTKLDNIQFTINHSWFEKCFTENEKRNYSSKYATIQFIPTDTPEIERNITTGQIKFNDIVYSPDLPSIANPNTLETKDTPEPTKNKYTDLINLIGDTATKLQTTCDAILERYDDNVELVNSAFEPLVDHQKMYANFYAKIANSKDVMDDRNKWGDYEKIMAKYLMESGETIAHMSKLMDYSSKFGSIGILNNATLKAKMEQLGECPKCKGNIYFEINENLKQAEIQAQFEI